MRKSISVILAVLYMLANVSVLATVHYCGGNVKDISVFNVNSPSCCCDGADVASNCCSDREISIEVEDKECVVSSNENAVSKQWKTKTTGVENNILNKWVTKELVLTQFQVPPLILSAKKYRLNIQSLVLYN